MSEETEWDKQKKNRPEGLPPTDWETENSARTAAGWTLKMGFPVVYNENYVVGNYTYYCNQNTTQSGRVWRIPTKDLP